ncbi:hypothetical protein OAA67_03605, partial [Winogradskyella sp.]|nr:hypothetical protein [Winogradskyella sp.]
MNKLIKVKRRYLLFLLPLIVATQCEEDELSSGFQTEYIIQNDSNTNLILFREGFEQVVIESTSNYQLGSELNQTTNEIAPSESLVFNSVKLYIEENENFILIYNQDPIDDSLWEFSEPSENRFTYRLTITDANL